MKANMPKSRENSFVLRCILIFVLLWAIAILAVSYARAEPYKDPLMCKPAPEFCTLLEGRCRLFLFGLEPTEKTTLQGILDFTAVSGEDPLVCDEWVGLMCYIDTPCPIL